MAKKKAPAKKKSSVSKPKYTIPKDKDVVKAITAVMKDRGIVQSQAKLKTLVEKQLNKKGSKCDFRVSAERVRHLAIQNRIATVEIDYRDTDKKARVMQCPVCDGKLKMVRNKTIFGGTVTLAKECTTCCYWIGLKLHIPTKYTFILEKKLAPKKSKKAVQSKKKDPGKPKKKKAASKKKKAN